MSVENLLISLAEIVELRKAVEEELQVHIQDASAKAELEAELVRLESEKQRLEGLIRKRSEGS